MTAQDHLKAHLQKRVTLTEDEQEEFSQSFKLMTVKKRQFIVQPGFISKNRYYVVTGSFRAYVIGDEGNEHTIQFAIDDWWITDYNSYIFQQPASMFVMALEDSTILQVSYESEQALKRENPKFMEFFCVLAEGTAAYLARRVITNLTRTAEQRYEMFLSGYPQVVNRVPQYALASFLGMTTEYLSKLRKRRLATKS